MRRARVLTVVLMLAAAGITACGEDDPEPQAAANEQGGNGAKIDEAKAIVEELQQPVQFEAPGPAVDAGTQLEGKTVYMVASALEFQFVQNIVNGVKEAADAVGVEFVVLDAAGQPAKAASLIDRGVARKADVIVTQAFPSASLAAPIRAAKAAGIPVIEVTAGDAGLPSPELEEIGISAIVSFCYSCAGEQLAATSVALHDGDVKAVVVDSPDFGTSDLILGGIKAGFAELCPDCDVVYESSPSVQWQQLPSLASSALQSNPDTNVMLPVFDEMGLLMKPGVMRSSAGDDVKMVSWAATLGAMQDLERGELFEGNVGASQTWLGWGVMDQAVRLMTGNEPAESENIPHRLFTEENIGELDLDAPETWYGPVDYRAEYQKLWGAE
jgi:ribose transport system substrate-binding protein